MEFCDFPIIRGEKDLPLFLGNMGQWVRQDHMIRPEGLSVHQILYCTRGSGTLVLDGTRVEIPPCTGVFLPADIPHEYYPNGDVWDIHWVVPAGYAAEDILRQFGLDRPKISELRDVGTLEHIFRKMHDAIRADSFFGNYRASGFLYDFLIEYYRQISSGGASPSSSPALTKAVDHINSAFRSEITLDELSGISGVSRQHLCLLFRNILRMRPMEYTARRRIQAAKELLTGTPMSVESIAEEVGFGSESYFCKQFRRYEGITPTAFRNARRLS